MEMQFIELCSKGELLGAQQYFQLHPVIDISAKNEEALRYALSNGHVLVALWVHNLTPYFTICDELTNIKLVRR